MSTRTYNLRTRPETGLANQSQNRDISALQSPRTPPARDLPPHMVGLPPCASNPVALYSDVVASRSPSPMKDSSLVTIVHPMGESSPERPASGGLRPDSTIVPAVSKDSVPDNEPVTSSEEVISPQDPGDAPWTTVK